MKLNAAYLTVAPAFRLPHKPFIEAGMPTRHRCSYPSKIIWLDILNWTTHEHFFHETRASLMIFFFFFKY